jgi:hypothetical protein
MFDAGTFDAIDALARQADAGTLSALAAFFEAQAKRFRDAAYRQAAKDSGAAKARERRKHAKTDYLKLGARCAVLERRYGNRAAAVSEMRNRTAWTAEQIERARSLWKRERDARRLLRRNVEIYKAHAAGEATAAIGQRFKLTDRQVRNVISERERALRQSAH